METILVAILSSAAFSTLFTTLLSRFTRPRVEKKTSEWITALELLEKTGKKDESKKTSLEKTVVNHIEFEIAQATAAAKEPKRGKHTYYEVSMYGFLSLLFVLMFFLFLSMIEENRTAAIACMVGSAIMAVICIGSVFKAQFGITQQLEKYEAEQKKVYEKYFSESPTDASQAASNTR